MGSTNACWNIHLNSESGSRALAYRTNSEAGYPVYDMRCWCSNVRRLAVSCAADAVVVQVGAKNQMRRSLARLCARICARMRRILLTIRDRGDFTRKTCLPFVKRVRFEMKSDALKSMISQPKSGAPKLSAANSQFSVNTSQNNDLIRQLSVKEIWLHR
jgi:hypothetical protein